MSSGTAKTTNDQRSEQHDSVLGGDITLTNGKHEKVLHCQYVYSDLASATTPDNRRALPLRRRYWHLKGTLWEMSILGPRSFFSMRALPTRVRKFTHGRKKVKSAKSGTPILDLRPGEWVEVRPVKEIFATLDDQRKLRDSVSLLKWRSSAEEDSRFTRSLTR